MAKLWAIFCTIIFVLSLLYLMCYPAIYAGEHNATECIFAKDIMTCTQIKNK